MKVRELMTREVAHCATDATLADAAHLMWDHDCGIVPVVDHSVGRMTGVVTDRDACMAAYTQGLPLESIPVTRVMSTEVVTCGPEDDVLHALELMRSNQVRRLPVVTRDGALSGMLSLNDVVRAASNGKGTDRTALARSIVDAFSGICRHRMLATA